MNTAKQKQLIGRIECIDFPKLKLFGIEAKVDTGAYSNALHCHDIRVVEENGKSILCFKLLDPTHPIYNEQEIRFKKFNEKDIKNSFGEIERRYIITTRIKIAGRIIKSVISLTNRGTMKYPVLIGRRLIKGKFLVDVSQSYLHSQK